MLEYRTLPTLPRVVSPFPPRANSGPFEETCWTLVARARNGSDTALNHLFTIYRHPLLVWALAQGQPADAVEDLVHGFFTSLLRRRFLTRVHSDSGRFRSFLLESFRNYLRDEVRSMRRSKRGGGQSIDSLDAQHSDSLSPSSTGNPAPPDNAFDRAWAQTVLQEAFRRLTDENTLSGHPTFCQELEPVLFADAGAPTYREIGERLNMSEGAVKMAAKRLRQQLAECIRKAVRETLSDESDLENELRYLRSLFERPHPFS